MAKDEKCDDCDNYAGIRVCTGCWSKQTGGGAGKVVRIVGVAIRYPGGLVCSMPAPNRHHNIIRAVCRLGSDDATPIGSEQGFMTSEGEFVDREAAGVIADSNGQAHRTVGSRTGGALFSEDVW